MTAALLWSAGCTRGLTHPPAVSSSQVSAFSGDQDGDPMLITSMWEHLDRGSKRALRMSCKALRAGVDVHVSSVAMQGYFRDVADDEEEEDNEDQPACLEELQLRLQQE